MGKLTHKWKVRLWALVGVSWVVYGAVLANKHFGVWEVAIIFCGIAIILIAMFKGRHADIYN